MLCMAIPVHHAEGGVRRRRANATLVRRPPRLVACVPVRTAPAPEAAHSDTTAPVAVSAALAFIRGFAKLVKRARRAL